MSCFINPCILGHRYETMEYTIANVRFIRYTCKNCDYTFENKVYDNLEQAMIGYGTLPSFLKNIQIS